MKIVTTLLFLFLLLPLNLWAEKSNTASDLDYATIPSGDPLDNEVNFQKRDKSTGVFEPLYNTGEDKTRVSFLYHGYYKPQSVRDFTGFEFLLSRKLSTAWWEFLFSYNQTYFGTITKNNYNLGPDSIGLNNTQETLTIFGTGLSYRFSWIQELLSSMTTTRRFFETTAAYLVYQFLSEKYRGESFTGPGLKTDFGIHYRVSRSYHFGIKMSYNLSEVLRPKAQLDETRSQRSLTHSWVSFAFDLSYYF
ncbi:MAG: hypothetical protein WCG27_04070 [Pseudomonadota bacterium]